MQIVYRIVCNRKPISQIGNQKCSVYVPHHFLSLGTRPSKYRKGGSGKSAGVEVYTAPGMQAHF